MRKLEALRDREREREREGSWYVKERIERIILSFKWRIIYEVFCLNLDSKSCYRNLFYLLRLFLISLLFLHFFPFHSGQKISLPSHTHTHEVLFIFLVSQSHVSRTRFCLAVDVVGEFIKYSDWSFHTWVNLHFLYYSSSFPRSFFLCFPFAIHVVIITLVGFLPDLLNYIHQFNIFNLF